MHVRPDLLSECIHRNVVSSRFGERDYETLPTPNRCTAAAPVTSLSRTHTRRFIAGGVRRLSIFVRFQHRAHGHKVDACCRRFVSRRLRA